MSQKLPVSNEATQRLIRGLKQFLELLIPITDSFNSVKNITVLFLILQ